MSARDGGPAFPVPLNPGEEFKAHGPADGMTLRDYFAAKALQGLLAAPQEHVDGFDAHAIVAYALADAMLKAREVAA